MKLTKTWHQATRWLLPLLPNKPFLVKPLLSLSLVSLVACSIWLVGDHLAWQHFAPFAEQQKKIYVILFLYLIWLLKFLILDLDTPILPATNDTALLKKLETIQARFEGALAFLKKTTISRQGKPIHLNDLPWYLLIGPAQSGKTALLANAQVNFILQRRQSTQTPITPSETCDWWITRDATIIDVPSSYLNPLKEAKKNLAMVPLWHFFLTLIKKERGKQGLHGILIALPLPELMKQSELKKYKQTLKQLFARLQEIQATFPEPLPCQLLITKCDQLAGFNEFFADSSDDEVSQAWGITLNENLSSEKKSDAFQQHFNTLIKKLNQQLLTRLHHERNPMLRPYIKDFPLQMERLKSFTLDFIKQFQTENPNTYLRGIYLTSALQPIPEEKTAVIEEESHTKTLTLFKNPSLVNRPYFIKQFITQGLAANKFSSTSVVPFSWKKRIAIITSLALITSVAIVLGRDFEKSIKQTYAIQNNLAEYRLAIQQISNPEERLLKTLGILEILHPVNQSGFKLDLAHLLSFYSYKSNQKMSVAYQQALATILIPEIKHYLAEFLLIPVNKNSDYVYGVLKAYLMLGNEQRFNANFITTTLADILPKTMNEEELTRLRSHIQLALANNWHPLALDTELIEQTRKYFTAMPHFQLGYIILKNTNSNNSAAAVDMGLNHKQLPIFISTQVTQHIPNMFTATAFPPIMADETLLAAQETISGNWVLGDQVSANKSPDLIPSLTEQLRVAYVNHYVDIWENLINNIHLNKPTSLTDIDQMIVELISNKSPLLQMLQTLHDNTYFEPVMTSSPKLHSLGALVDKNKPADPLLYQIFSSLQALHHYLQPILSAHQSKKAAFEAISKRAKNASTETLDPILQLRLVAEKSPEPVKQWLEKIADDSLHILMQEASRYLDTSWNEKVLPIYENDIANHYPFGTQVAQEVDLKKFTAFFGRPGIVMNFYQDYLAPFIDTTHAEWKWKKIDNQTLPFSDNTLRQIQHAFRIHHTFFPNGDNKLYVQFGLQPYEFSQHIQKVSVNLDDKHFTDETLASTKTPHVFTWPSNKLSKTTSIQLTTADQQIKRRHFPGEWGWFKLVNQFFENAVSKKALMVNFALDQHNAKYVLSTEGQPNPFLSLNLQHFLLPSTLTETKA